MERERSRREVRRAYNRIADSFARTRHAPWPEVRAYLDAAPPARIGIDIGCGNGRHLSLLDAVADLVIGLDLSRGLLHEARDAPAGAYVQGDALALPVRDDRVDIALFVATLHHLPTRADRIAALDELSRVLAPDGRALVSVWSISDERFDGTGAGDRFIPFTTDDGTVVDRYYHIYDRAGIEAELAASELVVEALEESSGNWYVRVRADGR